MKERINVYEIKQEGLGGTLYLDSLTEFGEIVGDVSDFEPNTKFNIRVLEVDKEWFDNLPEFECFE